MPAANTPAQQTPENGTGTSITPVAAASTRFLSEVERQFGEQLGEGLSFTAHEKKLAQHLYVKVDATLKAMDERRIKAGQSNKKPYAWANVNITKLAIDAVHRIGLGLDALIPNHIHPVAYWNGKINKYDLDLRVGYVGQDYCRRRLAVEPPIAITYELVHATDTFRALPRSQGRDVETYVFEINQPFDRGPAVGGFGYITYEDPRKNHLVLVTPRDFERARNAAQTQDFWKANDLEMLYKTVVHRVTSKIPLDPEKVNAASYARIEEQEFAADFGTEVATQANRQLVDTIDVDRGPAPTPQRDERRDDPNETQQENPQPAAGEDPGPTPPDEEGEPQPQQAKAKQGGAATQTDLPF